MDDVLERHPVRHRQDDFVAVIDQHLDRIEQCVLAADRGEDFLAPVIGTEIGRVALHDCVAQLRRSSDRRVFREVPLDRGNGRVLDVLGGSEMRLAGAEVDHVDALAAQLVGFGHDRHGGGRFDAVDAFGQFDRLGRFGRRCHAFFLALDFRPSDLSSLDALNSASL